MKKIILITAVLTLLGININGAQPQISANHNGNFTLILDPNGTVKSYGANTYGQLGDGTTINRSNYVTVANLANVSAISAGADFSLAISNGFVYAWGRGANGRLGNGSTLNHTNPVRVMISESEPLTNIFAVAAGGDFALALGTDDLDPDYPLVWAWGNNSDGQLGDTTYTARNRPVQNDLSSFGYRVDLITAGFNFAVAAYSQEQTVYTWGAAPGNGEDPADSQNVNWAQEYDLFEMYWQSGASTLRKLSAGVGYCLVENSLGEVWGWGLNNIGQLGNGTAQTRYIYSVAHSEQQGESQVTNLIGVIDVSAGYSHALAVKTNGQAYGWGGNVQGRLGNGTDSNSSVPVQVTGTGDGLGNTNIIAIAAGREHSVALGTNSSLGGWDVIGWGHHDVGQLGNGQYDWRGHPAAVSGINTASNWMGAATADQNQCYVILANQTLSAWGANDFGQIGDGGTGDRATPVTVIHESGLALTNIVAVDTGDYHTLAISNGVIWAWGIGSSGRLGNGGTSTERNPVTVSTATGLTDVSAISAGGAFSLAIQSTDGSVWSWGQNNTTYRELGIGTNGTFATSPQHVTNTAGVALTGFNLISAGHSHSLAVSNYLVWSWGNNGSGRLGIGSNVNQSNAVQIDSLVLSNVIAIAAGNNFSLALSNDTLFAWGENASGQLGIGNTLDKNLPTKVSDGFLAIAAGDDFAIAIKNNALGQPQVYTWGANDRGQLGLGGGVGGTHRSPEPVPGLTNVVAIGAGSSHAFAVKTNGAVVAWGDTQSGQNGDGNLGYKLTPIPAIDPDPIP